MNTRVKPDVSGLPYLPSNGRRDGRGRPTRDLRGATIGRLTVLRECEELPVTRVHPKQGRQWLCRCACGDIRYYKASRILEGNTKSCGCLRRQHQQDWADAGLRALKRLGYIK